MKRSFLSTSLVLVVFLASMWACKKEEQKELVTDSTASNEIRVQFFGAIAHVFGKQYGFSNRAVVLKARTGPPYNEEPHYFKITLPDSVDAARLAAATGAATTTNGRNIEVLPTKALTIRIEGLDTGTEMMSSGVLDTTATNFDKRVPHLQIASNNTLNLAALDTARIFATAPDGTDYAAFVELDGGTFDATAYCVKTHFVDDYARPPEGDREFGRVITLTGHLTKPTVLAFTDTAGATSTVGFNSPTYPMTIMIENLPNPIATPMSHFKMFKRLGKNPGTLTWNEVAPVDCQDQGPIPGCSNSAWP